jgi:hypothetical protein
MKGRVKKVQFKILVCIAKIFFRYQALATAVRTIRTGSASNKGLSIHGIQKRAVDAASGRADRGFLIWNFLAIGSKFSQGRRIMGWAHKIGCISSGVLMIFLPASGQQVGSKPNILTKLIEAREEKASYQKTIEGFIKQATPAGLPAAERESRAKAAQQAADFSKVQPQIEKIYEANFTEAEMAYLVSFLNSPVGKKFVNFESRKTEAFKNFYMNQFAVVRQIMKNKK